jgi:hypothetical protein
MSACGGSRADRNRRLPQLRLGKSLPSGSTRGWPKAGWGVGPSRDAGALRSDRGKLSTYLRPSPSSPLRGEGAPRRCFHLLTQSSRPPIRSELAFKHLAFHRVGEAAARPRQDGGDLSVASALVGFDHCVEDASEKARLPGAGAAGRGRLNRRENAKIYMMRNAAHECLHRSADRSTLSGPQLYGQYGRRLPPICLVHRGFCLIRWLSLSNACANARA